MIITFLILLNVIFAALALVLYLDIKALELDLKEALKNDKRDAKGRYTK